MRLQYLGLIATVGLMAAPVVAGAAPLTFAAPTAASTNIIRVEGGCGFGWHPVPGHSNDYTGQWVPLRCAPNDRGGDWYRPYPAEPIYQYYPPQPYPPAYYWGER